MGYAQSSASTELNMLDIDLAPNASHAICATYVIRQHGSVGIMAAGQLAACMYTDNTLATIVGSSHVIWSEDGTSGAFPSPVSIKANGSKLSGFVSVTPGGTTEYDYETVATVTSC